MKAKKTILYRAKDKQVKMLLKDPNTFWDGIEEIDNEGFYKCDKLVDIVVPGSVDRVLTRAFHQCPNLKSVVFQEGIKEIRKAPFDYTNNIEKVVFPASAKVVPECFCSHQRHLKELIINDGVEAIDDKAFYFCDSLEEITLPNSVKSIGQEAFAYCDNLVKVNLGANLENIGKSCFQGNEYLTDINIGKNIRGLNEFTFADCNRLKSINIEEGIKYIKREAFRTTGIEKIVIPSSVETIGDKVFAGCYTLREAEFKEGVKKIGFNVFEDCPRLEKVVLPSSIEEISKFNFIDARFNYIYKTNEGKTILSKYKEYSKSINKEYSLHKLNSALSNYYYYPILMNEEKLDELYQIVEKLEKQGVTIPSKMFEDLDELKTFVENSNLFNYNRLLIKLPKNYDGYDVTTIMKFANSIGMFANSNTLIKHDNNMIRASDLAYMSIKEALKLGMLKRGDLFNAYNSKPLKDCAYNEEKLLRLAGKVMDEKKKQLSQKNKR